MQEHGGEHECYDEYWLLFLWCAGCNNAPWNAAMCKQRQWRRRHGYQWCNIQSDLHCKWFMIKEIFNIFDKILTIVSWKLHRAPIGAFYLLFFIQMELTEASWHELTGTLVLYHFAFLQSIHFNVWILTSASKPGRNSEAGPVLTQMYTQAVHQNMSIHRPVTNQITDQSIKTLISPTGQKSLQSCDNKDQQVYWWVSQNSLFIIREYNKLLTFILKTNRGWG